MKIAGLVKQSFIDYPGKMVAVIFTQGCNFRCGYCHNPSLVLPRLFHQNQLIPVNEVLAYAKCRKNWLEGIVVTGGEPTIHGDLPLFLKQLKNIGLAVKLDTNGSNPRMLAQILNEGLIDFVAMDIKHIPETEKYNNVIGRDASRLMPRIHQSIELIKQSNLPHEFRTTLIPGIHIADSIDCINSFLDDGKPVVVNTFREGELVKQFTL